MFILWLMETGAIYVLLRTQAVIGVPLIVKYVLT